MAKTSPYIFPFASFRHLAETGNEARFTTTVEIDTAAMRALAAPFAPKLTLPESPTKAARVLALFTSPEVLFGEARFITDLSETWLPRIAARLDTAEPIDFTILGFPFKMPVPLKTDRVAADFGELVALLRLEAIATAVAEVHQPGARVHVFTEGPFHRLNGIPRAWADDYVTSLQAQVRRFDLRRVVLHDLNAVIDGIPAFEDAWTAVTADIRARRDAGDPATLTAIRDALPVRFHNIANPGVDTDTLRRAYLDDGSADDLRRSIAERAEAGVLAYRGFLEARDKVDLLDVCVPGQIPLTVSPRPGRLGVRPLPEPADKLPYHGVPVLSADRTRLRIDYLWDLLHGGGQYQKVRLSDDQDPAPYLYIED